MKALAIKQPWAHLIIRPDVVEQDSRVRAHFAGLFKDLENRTWHTKFRGRFFVHASAGMTKAEYADAYQFGMESGALQPPFDFPVFADLQRGGIIGSVELYDSVDHSNSPWYMGEKGFLLRNPKPLPFYPLKGRLGFFETGLEESELEALQ